MKNSKQELKINSLTKQEILDAASYRQDHVRRTAFRMAQSSAEKIVAEIKKANSEEVYYLEETVFFFDFVFKHNKQKVFDKGVYTEARARMELKFSGIDWKEIAADNDCEYECLEDFLEDACGGDCFYDGEYLVPSDTDNKKFFDQMLAADLIKRVL